MAQFRDDKLLNQIALRLKALREEHNLSQEELYNDTEVHVARIETSRVNISVSTLSKLCEYFGITLEQFFAGIKE